MRKLMVIVWLALPAVAVAQGGRTGRITGRVTEAGSGAAIVGAGVRIAGSTIGAPTDEAGRFTIIGVPAGAVTLSIRKIGYALQTVTPVVVDSGMTVERDVAMTPKPFALATQTVSASSDRGTVREALAAQHDAIGVISAVTAEQITRSPDRNAAQAVQRVSGVTVQDGKYVLVRGLSERYTTSALNGARLPSPEPERKVVPLDMFPSTLLQSITTSKTFTPDQSGDFSGASVDIQTREFPVRRVTTFSFASGYNAAATGKTILGAPTVGREWLGFAGAARALPGIFAGTGSVGGPTPAGQTVSAFRNVWSPSFGKGLPNYSTSLSSGGRAPVLGHSVGYVASGSYNFSQEVRKDELRARSLANGTNDQKPVNVAIGSTGRTSVLWGGLLNLNALFGDRHLVSLNNMYNRTADNEAHADSGFFLIRIEDPARRSTLSFVERSVRSNQLRVQHTLGDRQTLDWSVTSAAVTRREPDRVDVAYVQRLENGVSTPFALDLSDQDGARRSFADLKEGSWNLAANYRRGGSGGVGRALKLGVAYRTTRRDAINRSYSIQSYALTTDQAAKSAEQIIAQYANDPSTPLTVTDNSAGGSYTAREQIAAGYAMTELPLGERARLVTGVRVESWGLKLRTDKIVTTDVSDARPTSVDALPSLALNIKLSDQQTLRLSAARTVSRPEYREVSPLASIDLIGDVITNGNPDLKRATIDNYDARWEVYPAPGEVLSVGAFGKQFHDPIEKVEIATAGASTYSFVNTDGASTYGVELEARRGLPGPLQPVSLFANATLMRSVVDVGNATTVSVRGDGRRPMVGQSPYVVNGGLTWASRWVIGTALYNISGKRIVAAGNSDLPDTYEMPRPVLDLSFQLRLFGGVSSKIDLRNLLDAPYEHRQGSVTRLRYTSGRVVSVGFSLKP